MADPLIEPEGEPPAITPWERLLAALDNRLAAMVVLFVLLIVVVGIVHPILFLVLLFAGYVLIDRFAQARRCIIAGGASWLLVIFIGAMMAEYARGPLLFDIGGFFSFCGFLLAVAVCAAVFAGRAMYRVGFERARREADHAIAQHLVDRLIDHPGNWGHLDGDFLEVESAFNRVRERQRQAAQALRDEAGRKDDLVTYLAHDLKTPLASVVGYLSLLEEAPELPPEQRARFTGIALRKAHRLDELIEEFFDITRFDFHDIVLTRGRVDLNFMLAQVADEFYPTLTEQHKTVEITVPQGLTVLVDGDKMARVFNNVMKNAIAYSYADSTIRITAERLTSPSTAQASSEMSGKGAAAVDAPDDATLRAADRAAGADVARVDGTARTPSTAAQQKSRGVTPNQSVVRICFENHGDPIPAPKLKVIFEKFYRLDAARATNRGGAGLGLAIAREIVNAHGGSISCASNAEHTVFTIELPDEASCLTLP